MNKKYLMRIDILNMFLRFMVTFTIMSMLTLAITNDAANIWRLLILFQASVLSFIINKYTKHIWTYIVFHLFLLAIYVFLTDDMIIRAIYGVYILAYAITQFALDLKKKMMNTSLIFSILFLVMYSVCRYSYAENAALSRFFFYFAVAYGLLYIINMYYINLTIYLRKHYDKSNVPLKQINASSRVYVMIFIYLCFVGMLAFTKFPMDKLFQAIGKIVIRFLRFLFSGLAKKPQENYVPEEVLPEMDYNMMDNTNSMIEARPSVFWDNVFKILRVSLLAAFVIIIVIMIFYGLYNIYKLYYNKKVFTDDEEKVEIISPFKESSFSFIRDLNSSRIKLLNMFGKSYNDKIRKQYQKAVLKNTKPDQELKYDTPSELSKYALAQDAKLARDSKLATEEKKERENTLTALYEKARYSNEECSKEEAQSVKELLKK